MALTDKMKTDQEKKVLQELTEQPPEQNGEVDMVTRAYSILKELQYLLEQEETVSLPFEPQALQPVPVSVSKEGAVQLLLELEREEQEVRSSP